MYAYELHAHDGDEPVDYGLVFRGIAETPRLERQDRVPRTDEVVAIPEIRDIAEGQYALRFVVGREGDVALFYNLEDGTEREERPRDAEIAVQSSWLFVDARKRVVLQERRRPGVPLRLALRALKSIAREQDLVSPRASFKLNPVIGGGFVDEVLELESIKTATLVLQEPNLTWHRGADAVIESIADDSHAESVDMTVKSKPGQSLAKDQGIVAEMLEMVRERYSALKDAKVRGRRPGEESISSVTTKRHAVRKEVALPENATLQQEQEAVVEGGAAYLQELATDQNPDNLE
jgi:hypothetical protein